MESTNSIEQRFTTLKKQVTDLKMQKTRLEGEMSHLNQEKLDILKQATELGIDVKQLDTGIAGLERDIQAQLVELEHKVSNCNESTRLLTE